MKAKRWICAALALLVLCLSACSPTEKREVTCGEVAAAYEDAGYQVLHKDTATQDWEWNCYVRAEDPETEEYIFFYFFDTEEEAKSYAKTNQWSALLWVFSVIFGEPTWVMTETYNNIEYEYSDSEFIKPFRELIG